MIKFSCLGLQSYLQREKGGVQGEMGEVGVRKEGNEENVGQVQQYCQGETEEGRGWIEQVYEREAKTDSYEEKIEQTFQRIWAIEWN